MPIQLRFELSTIVWGEKYTTTFLEWILPNYLSPNNIPLASQHYSLFSSILTTPGDKERIASHPHYKKLREYIDGEILPVIDQKIITSNSKWGAKGYCQSLAISKAIANRSVILLLNPDVLISDGGFFRCCSLVESGKKAVLVGELVRIDLESLLPDLKRYYDPNTLSLTLPNRILSELGTKHFHEVSQLLFWEGQSFCQWPSVVYWKVGQKSLLAKFFHVHPLAIDLRKISKKLPQILMPDDGGLIEFLGLRREEMHQVTDSNELVCIEVNRKNIDNAAYVPCPTEKRQQSLIRFSLKYTIPTHIQNFLNFNVRFQGTEEIDWNQAEHKTEKDLASVRPILKMIFFLYSTTKLLRSIARRLGAGYVKRKITRLLNSRGE
jgi:hypothetical protein